MRKPFRLSRAIRALVLPTALALSTVPVFAQSIKTRTVEPILGQPGSDRLAPELVRQLPRHRLFTAAPDGNDRVTAHRDDDVWSALRSTKSRFVVEGFPLEKGLRWTYESGRPYGTVTVDVVGTKAIGGEEVAVLTVVGDWLFSHGGGDFYVTSKDGGFAVHGSHFERYDDPLVFVQPGLETGATWHSETLVGCNQA